MARLSLSTLGRFAVTLDGVPVSGFESAKVRALLAYLAVEGDRPHPRESVAGLLWPDWPPSSALRNLRDALANLRQVLGEAGRPHSGEEPPPFLLINRQTLQFNPVSDHDLDVAALDAAARQPRTKAPEIETLERAVESYRGPFLEGLAVDSAPFEQWMTQQREQAARQYLAVLRALTALHEQNGDLEQALVYARKQVAADPLDEEARRQLMRALALGGARSTALAEYEACARVLAEELDLEPAAETVALAEAIRQGKVGPRHERVGPIHELALRVSVPPKPEEAPEAPRPLFVARERELAQLDEWLGQALAGQGRVGFVVGEPGSGKTSLLRELARRAMEAYPALLVAGGSCDAYAGIGDPYLPFVELLQTLLGDIEARRAVGGIDREHARRLRVATPLALGAVLQAGPALVDSLLAGTTLLERARSLPDAFAWEERVQKAIDRRPAIPSQTYLLEQATRVLQAVAKAQPLLLILDDLQWSDTASLSLLFHLGRRLAGHRILVLGTYRPEEVAAGRGGQPHPLAPVVLELRALWEESEVDLAQTEGRAFVDALVDSEPNRLGAEFREALHRHTGGHALFTAELLRGLQQRGDLLRDGEGRWVEGARLDWGRLPKRVEAVIAAHIARLSREEQELLSVASVEGEEFHAEVVARVLQSTEGDVLRDLSGPLNQEHRLVMAQSLRRIGAQRFSRYRFRHYLFQHYLYQRLDAVRRADLHGQVAEALEALGGAPSGAPKFQTNLEVLLDDYADLFTGRETVASESTMAVHWEEAGIAEKAALYYIHAFRRVQQTSVTTEEIVRIAEKALDVLADVPDSPWRVRVETLAYTSLGIGIANLTGWLAPEAGEALRRSVARAEQTGDGLLVCCALFYLASYHRQRGDLATALSLNERAVELAQGGPPLIVGLTQIETVQTLVLLGEFASGLRLYRLVSDPAIDSQLPTTWEFVNPLIHASWILWCLGYPDQAIRLCSRILEMILREPDKPTEGPQLQILCDGVCFIHQLRREMEETAQGSQKLSRLVEEHLCTPVMRPFATLYQGWVQAQRSDLEQGIETLRRGIAEWSQSFVVLRPYWKGYLAQALGRAGRADEGLAVLEEAIEQAERTGEGFSLAELYRLKGELLLQKTRGHGDWETRREDEETTVAAASCRAPLDEADACFRRAIEVAREQEAHSWELRATTSLARLLQAQGRVVEGREMLSAIYGWFTEGFDTPDLVEAKALLDNLRGEEMS